MNNRHAKLLQGTCRGESDKNEIRGADPGLM